MYYREYEPDPALQSFVTCYWEFKAQDLQEPIYPHVVMPDGCISIVYRHFPGDDDIILRLVGPRLDSITVPVHPSDVFWGIRMWPGAAGCLLPVSPRILYNQVCEAEDCIPDIAASLLKKLPTCNTEDAALRTFDEVLLERVPAAKPLDEKVVAGVTAIVAAQGEIKIGALVERLGLSERQFQRRFQEAVGLTPKQFARIRRFRTSMSNALEDEPRGWGRVAAEHGFADQPHLIREFSQLVGESPTTFAERLRAIEHGPVNP